MHKFLKSIGFSDIRRKETDKILEEIIAHPDHIKVTKDSEGNEFAELSKEFATNMGIVVRGIYEDDDTFTKEYYCPYFKGTTKSTDELVDIEKHAEKETYAGVCDEIRLGVSLIFYIQNVVDYLADFNRRKTHRNIKGVVLAGLCSDGKILLPVENRQGKRDNSSDNAKRSQLIAKAREGDEDAIENLTMEDMDLYTVISRRILQEDVLSIVSTYFIPYGIECDQYSILGEIMECSKVENSYTKESIYCMKLSCNDLIFDVCINEKDLLGEPDVGRRFKGNLWMQGNICLDS